jgi:hypothetical protein
MLPSAPSLTVAGIYTQDSELTEQRDIYKTWMNTLNLWVVRNEHLRKFIVLKEIGFGA